MAGTKRVFAFILCFSILIHLGCAKYVSKEELGLLNSKREEVHKLEKVVKALKEEQQSLLNEQNKLSDELLNCKVKKEQVILNLIELMNRERIK